jgi:hypothetical protein
MYAATHAARGALANAQRGLVGMIVGALDGGGSGGAGCCPRAG